MRQLTQLTDDAKQKLTFVLDDGTKFIFELEYRRNVQGWYFTITYGDYVLSGQRLSNHPNLLRQQKNILPFGLLCYLEDGTEPMYIDDFYTGRAELYILDQNDVEGLEEAIIDSSGR